MSVRTLEFTNSELAELVLEINEFLKEKVSLYIKYKMNKALNDISFMVKPYLEIRNKEILRIEPSGVILEKVGVEINPKYTEFQKSMELIDKAKHKVEWEMIEIKYIQDITTNNNYPILYKLFSD